MDIEQLQKRIQWVEEDRRKEKDAIALLENKFTALEGNLGALLQQGKDLSSEITRLSAVILRMDQYDQALIKARVEANRPSKTWIKQSNYGLMNPRNSVMRKQGHLKAVF